MSVDIYVIFWADYDGGEPVGAFTSEEAAREALPAIGPKWRTDRWRRGLEICKFEDGATDGVYTHVAWGDECLPKGG